MRRRLSSALGARHDPGFFGFLRHRKRGDSNRTRREGRRGSRMVRSRKKNVFLSDGRGCTGPAIGRRDMPTLYQRTRRRRRGNDLVRSRPGPSCRCRCCRRRRKRSLPIPLVRSCFSHLSCADQVGGRNQIVVRIVAALTPMPRRCPVVAFLHFNHGGGCWILLAGLLPVACVRRLGRSTGRTTPPGLGPPSSFSSSCRRAATRRRWTFRRPKHPPAGTVLVHPQQLTPHAAGRPVVHRQNPHGSCFIGELSRAFPVGLTGVVVLS
jgi:hypothetical protein